MAEAKEFIAAHPSAEGMTQSSTWVEVVATGILLDHGQLNEAAAAIHRLENDPRAAPQQLRDLKRRLMTLRKKQQRRLDL